MDYNTMRILVLLIQGLVLQAPPIAAEQNSQTTDDDFVQLVTQLNSLLYTDYDRFQRPSAKVTVNVSLNLLTINSLDIRTQTLSTTGYFELWWSDTRLKWSGIENYTDISNLFSNEDYTWRPALIVENNVKDLAVFSDKNTLIRVNPQGQCLWSPGGVYETSCEADVTYYPLDVQTCTISLSTWAYTASEVALQFADTSFVLTYFQENGEWELDNIETSLSESLRVGTYSRCQYILRLRRRPMFHLLNTILPVIIMASLTIFVFKLPPESGERVGMSLTVLLAYAVYLTLISSSIPNTSLSASILSKPYDVAIAVSDPQINSTCVSQPAGKYIRLPENYSSHPAWLIATYLFIILLLSALSVVGTIVVLDIYFNHDDDEEIPAWLQRFTRDVLARAVCWRGARFCKRNKRVHQSMEYPETAEKAPNDVKLMMNRRTPTSRSKNSTCEINAKRDVCAFDQERQTTNLSQSPEPGKVYTWKEIALIMDRCFLYIFIVLVVGCTVICMSILASHYAST